MKMKKILLIVSLTMLGGGIGYYYVHRTHTDAGELRSDQGPIYDYNGSRDRHDIDQVFSDPEDRYWLLWDPSEFYDLDLLLDYRAPSHDPLYVGKLIIKVLRENGAFVGFTCYYKKTLTEGTVLFLTINKEFRGKGYATKLMQYVMQDLKKRGSNKITLFTRASNVRAQALYEKLGFTISSRTDGGINYEKNVR